MLVTLISGEISSSNQSDPSVQRECAQVVKYALKLLLSVILSDGQAFLLLYNFPALKDWLQCLILRTAEPRIRRKMINFIETLCVEAQKQKNLLSSLPKPPSAFFLGVLFGFLDQVEEYQDSEQYFELTSRLLRLGDKDALIFSEEVDPNQWKALLSKLTKLIINHQLKESSVSSGKMNRFELFFFE